MIFVGKTTKKGSSGQAYSKVERATKATHLKVKGKNEFLEITDKLVIKKKNGDNGTPGESDIRYYEINPRDEYVCEVNGEDVAIESSFYAQLVFMNKNKDGKGLYYRCEDGRYINKNEIQVPAYKKMPMPTDHNIIKTRHFGDYYTTIEKIIVNGEEINLPNANVKHEDGKWYYIEDGNKVECKYKKEDVDISHLLLDGDKVVDLTSASKDGGSSLIKQNGTYVLTNVGGEDVELGKEEVSIEGAIVEGSTISPIAEENQIVIPHNQLKQRPRLEQTDVNVVFTWAKDHPGPDGLVRIDVNKSRTWAKFTYADGRQKLYAQYDVSLNLKENVEEVRVQKFNIIDLGDSFKFEFLQKQNNIAKNIEFRDGKVSSYTLNDTSITDILWSEVDGYDEISSYIIGGVKVTDVEWRAGEVKHCKLHLKDENGNEIIEEVANLKDSKYKEFAITYKVIEKIEDLKVDENGKVSFKMGDYKFSDAEINEDGNITNCKLKKGNGAEAEIDLSTDERFKHLKVTVNILLDEQRIVPLVRSKLMEKTNGVYHLTADVVQTNEMRNNVATATTVQNVEQATKEQEKFKKSPYTTSVIDQNGRAHKVSDFKTTYDGVAEFNNENNAVARILGKDKLECKNGRIVVDASKDNKAIENWAIYGFALCANPITLVFGMAALTWSATRAIISPISRMVRKAIVVSKNMNGVSHKVQNNAKAQTQENINKLIDAYKRNIKTYKQQYSMAELTGSNGKLAELRESFISEYNKEVAGLHLLGGGRFEGSFDMGKDSAITPENYLAYLAAVKKRSELERGKTKHPDYDLMINSLRDKVLDAKELEFDKMEIMQRYGGRNEQISAYNWQMKNLEFLLEKENDKIRKNNIGKAEEEKQELITLETLKKRLRREYNTGRIEWGSVTDKVDAFKESEEYLNTPISGRAKLLKQKKKAFKDELKNVKVDGIELIERFDKNGKPLVDVYAAKAMQYREEVLTMFNSGDTRYGHKFSFDTYHPKKDKNNDIEKDVTETLVDGVATRIDNNAEYVREVDAFRSKNYLDKVETKQKALQVGVDKLTSDFKTILKGKDYEEAFKLGAAIDSKMDMLNRDAMEIENKVLRTSNAELHQSRVEEMLKKVTDTKVKYTIQSKRIEHTKEHLEEEYKKQVNGWALEEFVKNHKSQYARFTRELTDKYERPLTINEEAKMNWFFNEMKKQEEISTSVNNEFEMLKVKNDIEANVEADAYCEEFAEDYKAFIEAKNQGSSKQIDPNSEIARCYFYSQCKLKNNVEMKKWKEKSKKKVKEVAQRRLEEGTLVKHSKNKQQVTEQLQVNANADIRTVEPTTMPTPSVEEAALAR